MESQRVRHNLATEQQQNSTSATLVHLGVLKHAKYVPISGPLHYPSQNQEDISILLVHIMHINMYVLINFRKRRLWHLVPSLNGKQMGKQWKQCQTLFGGAPKSLQMVTAALKLKDIREGSGTPLQYSCLENPMDRGAWWAAVHGSLKSQT